MADDGVGGGGATEGVAVFTLRTSPLLHRAMEVRRTARAVCRTVLLTAVLLGWGESPCHAGFPVSVFPRLTDPDKALVKLRTPEMYGLLLALCRSVTVPESNRCSGPDGHMLKVSLLLLRK